MEPQDQAHNRYQQQPQQRGQMQGPIQNDANESSTATLGSESERRVHSVVDGLGPGSPLSAKDALEMDSVSSSPFLNTGSSSGFSKTTSTTSSGGHGGGQSSSSIGVRSAFKDFVVPAQIILVCSILNALWPTMLRIVTTTLEFLVLEAIYVGAIQWALRSVFCILFMGALVFTAKRVQKIWSSLMNNRQRPRPFWSPDNICSWIMTYPNRLWILVRRIFPWKITRSAQNRSAQGTRHHRKTTSTTSPTHATDQPPCPSKSKDSVHSSSNSQSIARKITSFNSVDTDTFSAGSGSESKARVKSRSRKSKPPPEKAIVPLSRSSSANAFAASEPTTPSETDSPQDSKPILISKADPDDKMLSTVGIVSHTVYQTADDDDFISTDRRRRRKMKGFKSNSAANSTESLVKQTSSSSLLRDQEVNAPPAETVSKSIASTPAVPVSAAAHETPRQMMTPLHESIHPEKPPAVKVPVQAPVKTLSRQRDTTPGQPKQAVQVKDPGSSLQHPSDINFVHPLHALNSTSPIVRLKPSHKRSQSAQLPSCSPWSIPPASGSSAKVVQESSMREMTLPASPTSPTDASIASITSDAVDAAKDTQDYGSKEYDVVGQSSIWYSPFQSGLDISIESDQEQGKHGSRSLTKPKPRIQVDLADTQQKPHLGSFLPASSFFESSPRTPRIMPFSQHYTTGLNSSSSFDNEDWSMRTRSSSIAAPMTPLLESDCVDPMDYFGGSRSANSSRRGSIENNLTESLLSGRARMFASSSSLSTAVTTATTKTTATGSDISSTMIPGLVQTSAFVEANSTGTLLPGGTFLPPRFNPTLVSSPLATFSSSSSPLIDNATPLPTTSPTDSLKLTSDASLNSVPPVFVNPWESNYPYRSNHTVSETFLPFGSSSSSSLGGVDQGGVERSRQASLLRLMNDDAMSTGGDYSAGGGGGNAAGAGVGVGVSSFFNPTQHENEMEAIRTGFLLPNIARHSGSSLHQHQHQQHSEVPKTSTISSSTAAAFSPFASVEMSLAAAANQPPPTLEEEPQYDFVELTMKQELAKRSKSIVEGTSHGFVRILGGRHA
ncbi:hypothetical protein BGX28_010250 [Mortierella sp. GBA30]|nr:hypothetical protein BGX28_010250 [Mortierella sp. GBA30]